LPSSDAGRGKGEAWREEFPYRIDSDEAIGRRHFLALAVLTSGAVLVSTIGLALRGLTDDRRRGSPRPVGRIDDFAVGEATYIHYPGADDAAVVLRLDEDRFVAYSQKCTHLSCAVRFRPEEHDLHCPCHEGVFDVETGEPVAGPPRRRLPRIELRREADMLVAVEETP
jgi:nitrite reductase/ring-hydroxylating ferredoxin subunit